MRPIPGNGATCAPRPVVPRRTYAWATCFGICVDKDAEMDAAARKYKYRVVVQGNRIVDQNDDAAIFQDF
eukprot:6410421-Lingulodinium_polyedra.AAC.1